MPICIRAPRAGGESYTARLLLRYERAYIANYTSPEVCAAPRVLEKLEIDLTRARRRTSTFYRTRPRLLRTYSSYKHNNFSTRYVVAVLS